VWKHEWPDTDFTSTTITNWSEIKSGGPPKDGIPALNDPSFIEVASQTGIQASEPVITVEITGQIPRAYPVRYLMWHEIVNDRIADRPIAVTFCPLCNSALTFERETKFGTLTFGVTGKLRNSDMLMYDRETQSWWQQAVGTAIAGELSGTELRLVPSWMESWQEFTQRNPDGLVMAEPPFNRSYGSNPYRGYDSMPRPFLYNGEMPPHGISPLERVLRIGNSAWPLTRLQENVVLVEKGYTISWKPGQASALDTADISKGRDIGSIRVKDSDGNNIAHDVMFAFAYHAFWPKGVWMLGQ
jgi:hypothetical protein